MNMTSMMKYIASTLLFLLTYVSPALAARHLPPPMRDVEVPASFTIDNVVYNINEDGVTVTAAKVNGTPSSVVVLDTASYVIDMGDATYGWDFPVTEVGTWFCRDNMSLRTLSLGENITLIGGGFLRGCTSLTRVKCRMKEPAKISTTTMNLKDVDLENCTLIVPVGSLASYTDPVERNAHYWRDFGHIIESDGPLFEPGDVNGDNVISGADVSALYNYLLDGTPFNGDADVNGDGVISGADVSALYNLLLE